MDEVVSVSEVLVDAPAVACAPELVAVVSGEPIPSAGYREEVILLLAGVMVVLEMGMVVAMFVLVARRSNMLTADRTHGLSTETSPMATTISMPVVGSRQLIARARGDDVAIDVCVPVAAVSVLVVADGMSDEAPVMF